MDRGTWTKEQWEVITAGDCNLLVAAAAGAGKTAVLVQRIIRKLTEQKPPVDLDRLLVVTFTNAAATEMRERIADAIVAALERNPDSARIQRQLVLLNKASIMTIHSFCLEVIRSNFHKLDLDPNFRIADETEARLLQQEILQELFEEIYEKETEDKEFFQLLESYGGNRDDQILQDIVLNLFAFTRSCPWPEKWLTEMAGNFCRQEGTDFSLTPWGSVLLEAVAVNLKGLRAEMAKALAIIQAAAGLEKYDPVFREELAFISETVALCVNPDEERWDKLYRKFQDLEFRKLPVAAKEADRNRQQAVKAIRDHAKIQLNKLKEKFFAVDSAAICSDLQSLYPLMRYLTEMVKDFGEKYARKKKEKALADFNDLEHFCLQILTEQDENGEIRPSAVARGYRERFEEILVDEYQDSNLVQEIILGMISREANVFMVGDVKQSIYRFRQARPELFLEKYHTYSLDPASSRRKILLYKNFRSRREVVAAVNDLFQQIMSVTVGELDYTEEEALHAGACFPENPSAEQVLGGSAELHLIQTGKGEESFHSEAGAAPEPDQDGDSEQEDREEEELLDNIQYEARVVVRRVQELMAKDKTGRYFAVFDKNQQEYRRITYKDIVVLLRATKNWTEVFREEFAAAGIPVFADTGVGFLETIEIQVVLSLLKIIDNPLQDIPLLAVLRSPLYALTTDELAELRLAKQQGPLWEALKVLAQKNGAGASRAAEKARLLLRDLRRWQEMSFYLSTDRLLWQLYTETGYYGIVGAMRGGEQRQANLRVLFERARQYEKTSYQGLFNFINFIDRLKTGKGDLGSAKLLGENDNVIRLMSIHKSKGLEFPVVILAGCGKKFNVQDMNKSILLDQDLGLGPDVVDYKLRFSYPSLPKQAIREKSRRETLSEEMRILYVALTRAKEKLIVTGAVRDINAATAEWLRCSETESRNLPGYEILQGEKYLDWIGPAVIRSPGAQSLRDLAGMEAPGRDREKEEKGEKIWDVRLWSKADITREKIQTEAEEESLYRWLEVQAEEAESASPTQTIQPETDQLREEVSRRLAWQYPYAGLAQIPAKLSVTELKRRYEEEHEDLQPLLRMKRPLFLLEKRGLTAAEAGTAMHFVMQHLDFHNADIEGQIALWVEHDLLTKEQASSIDPGKIRNFTDSPLGRRLFWAEKMEREVPFNMEIGCREIFPGIGEEGDNQKILLQGVIDCYWEEPDGLVLLDYKTDRVGQGGLPEIKERYAPQIAYYTRALEILTGKAVKEKYVYLFSTGDLLNY
jgi:ATP-dependent helicase/nuclease subunit A